ncbi:MAG: hypothetical protein ABGY75_07125 [Gemmataceae bacterium]
MRVLAMTNLYPNPYQPHRATFNRHQFRLLNDRHPVQVIAPIAWTDELKARRAGQPPLPTDRRVTHDGLTVDHPRYLFPPKVGRRWYGHFFRAAVGPAFRRAVTEFRPDVVFTPWAYPDGWAAGWLARVAGLPVEEYGELYERSPKLGSYTLNIDRSYVTFRLGEDRTLRLYYTPLIFRKDEAVKRGDAFYRLGGGLPYSPDYLIEVRQGEHLEMGVILDAKYMKDVSRESRGLRKYLPAIRDTYSDDRFSRTLWIIYVGDANEDEGEPPFQVEIHSDQPAFIHNDTSRVQVRSEHSVAVGSMRFAPRPWEGPDSSQDQLHTLLRPLLRELGVPAARYRPAADPPSEAVVGMRL